MVRKSSTANAERGAFLIEEESFAIKSSRSSILNEARTDIYISEMFVEGIMVDLIIDLDISKCKSKTISQYGQIYFVDLPLCILNGIIAEPYSEVVFD